MPDEARCADSDCASVPLTVLRPGEGATVTCLQDPASRRTYKLAALGILPGARVVLLQRYPAFVFRMGYTEIALDAELARRVRIQPD